MDTDPAGLKFSISDVVGVGIPVLSTSTSCHVSFLVLSSFPFYLSSYFHISDASVVWFWTHGTPCVHVGNQEGKVSVRPRHPMKVPRGPRGEHVNPANAGRTSPGTS